LWKLTIRQNVTKLAFLASVLAVAGTYAILCQVNSALGW
jgi:hypothetical protein